MTKKKLDTGTFNTKAWDDLAAAYREGAAAYKKECAEFWDNMSEDDRLKAFYSVVLRLSQGELKDQNSYRGIIYENFGFGPEAYGVGMECGLMELHNAIYDKDELEAWAKRTGYVKEIKND